MSAPAELQLPPLPAGSKLAVSEDEAGQPRIRWRVQSEDSLARLGQVVVLVCFFVVALAVPKFCLESVFRLNFSWALLAGWASMSICWGVTSVLIAIYVAAWLDPGRHHATLVLKEHCIHLDAGRKTTPQEHGRAFITEVRLEPPESLLIVFGDSTLEVGPELTPPDRAWLTEVLRDWVRRTVVPPETVPPGGSDSNRVTLAPEHRVPPPNFQLPGEGEQEMQPDERNWGPTE